MKLDFDDSELDKLADALALKVAERLRPLLKAQGQDRDTVFTVDSLCEYLHVPKSKIYNMVHLKGIPYVKVGKALRFRKGDIDRWLQEAYTPAVNGILNHFKKGVER